MAFPKKFKPETIARHAREREAQAKERAARSWIVFHWNAALAADLGAPVPLDEFEARRAALQNDARAVGVTLPDLAGKTLQELKALLNAEG